MQAQELRRAWTDFWTARQHTDVPSAGLIPLHPSAPMFTNSGMMPFVPYFIGEEPVPYRPPRASSIQTCVRAGGKHNDLDAIGRSPRHLSFFEMLGNFSFGDYFKADAIRWAWEFSTEVLGLDADRIWVTCHVDDDEAAELWVDEVGFPAERIQGLTNAGLNLAGVERVLGLEEELREVRAELERTREAARKAITEAERKARYDLVPVHQSVVLYEGKRRR